MNTENEQVRRILDRLAEGATSEEIPDHIHVVRQIERGLKDLEEGRTVSHEAVKQRLARWLQR